MECQHFEAGLYTAYQHMAEEDLDLVLHLGDYIYEYGAGPNDYGMANGARLNLVRSLVARLDQPGSQSPSGNIYVVYLKNAEATKLAVTLRAAMASGPSSAPHRTMSANLSGAAMVTRSALPSW